TDTIEVVVPVSADSAARVAAVNEAFENHSPAIPDPQKTDGSADSTYTFTGFEPDENGVYQPTFEAEVKTETVVIAYGDSDDERIDVIFLVTYNNKERLATIDSALAAQNPPVVVKKTNGSDDSTYTHIGWQTKIDKDSNVVVDENGNPIYEPMFEATVKTTELVVVYGADPEKDVVRIPVPVTLRDSAARVQLVIDSLAAWKITPTKTDEDSTYTFDKWNVDGDTYTAEFISSPKYIEVVVGDDTVKVKVPVDDEGGQGGSQGDDVAVEIKVVVDEDTLTVSVSDGDVLDSVIKEVVKDDPTKTGEDSTYEFSGWEPITDDTGKPVVDENGNPIYGPVFDAEVKKETMVIAYGDGVDERINVVVPVTYGENERIDAIDSALKAHTPPIEVKKTNGSDDSTYTHIGWQTKIDKDSNVVVDENDNAVYEPMFKASVKTAEVVVVYGADPEKDVVRIQIPVTLKDSESRIEAVSDSLAARDISPAKADEDSTYTFDKWNVDGNTFTAEFKSTVKTIELVVVYGSDPAKDSIHVVVHVPDNDSIRLEKVKAAIETAGIIPMKAEDADSIYSFNGNWAKTEDGFRAEFDGKAKFIKVVVGEDSVKVSIPEDQISGLDEGEDVVVEVKVVVDGDTIKVPVSEGDNLDSAANKVLDSIPTKDDTADSTYEFAGWEPITDSSGKSVVDENGNEIYEPVFDADVKKETIVVSTGDDKGSTIEVLVKVTDSDAEIQDAIKKSFEENDIPLPSKSRENEKVYTFEKFVYNKKSGIFEPKFDERVLYDITFVLPENGKLLSEFDGYVYGERTVLPEACINGDDEWNFKGWYTQPNGLGSRVKMMLETDMGNKTFYPLFQKTISYNVNGKKGAIEVIYSENAEKNILRALDRVIPEDYSKKNVNYTFDKWILENGTYVAKFVEGQGIRSSVQKNFHVNVVGHALEISGVNSGSEICVFDVRGSLVQRAVMTEGSLHMGFQNAGRYIVCVGNKSILVNIR
ncbi:MAG: InlB B-repeat-containing protein, partial [Fibrobacter sp.]|nr:InlB B-repeat-containing protein [Fibrobacter sp.]